MNCISIKDIKVKRILTSNKTFTIEVFLQTSAGAFKASAPSGVSTGKNEAVSLPAERALSVIKKIIKPTLAGKSFSSQGEFDKFFIDLDGTSDKSRLGANVILALSMAFYRAERKGENRGMGTRGDRGNKGTGDGKPRPMFNLIEGGRHSDSGLAVQEFLAVPNLADFAANLLAGKKIQKVLGGLLKKQFSKIGLGNEGGFSAPIKNTEGALDILTQAIKMAGYGGKVDIALDVAATSFYKNGKYNFEGKLLTGEELGEVYKKWLAKYPLISIEDPFAETDYASWQKFVRGGLPPSDPVGGLPPILTVGDDLTCTNQKIMQMAKEKGLCNAVIIKPNQIGSISETLAACKLAKQYGWKIIISHRAGETKDSFIADLAVLVGADFIKSGAPSPKERMAKYKRLASLLKI